ncbi:MAG: GDP-L-fucose synthase [Acidobacteria bacterium]|nr:GDP-L-fucose synthase [Acidobacteriota bacterium]MCA1632244.1 GDP-L-fucose synthase [Acidobacteriota bacterium]MCA1640424.1 GDP-L-fucose synthase [Acidobacteriota bacterium]
MDTWTNNFPYRRVAVTGGAGFLGRYVVGRLKDVPGVEVFVPRSRDYNLVEGADVGRMLDDSRPDLVIHMAAVVGGIGHNQKNPGRFLYENLMMGTQLIEQSRVRGVKKFLALGTVCAYPKFTPVPFREDDLWNGYPEETNAPYGLAKKMMLAQVQAYREQYDFNGIFLLPSNLYGPGDNFDLETSHVIPALIRKCVAARREGAPSIEAWGTGDVSREFLYVEDCADGILRAAASYDEPLPVNLGNGREVFINALVETIARLTGFEGEIRWQPARPNGQPKRQLDTTRAREKFGFVARTSLEEGLRKTIDWYEKQG